MGRGRKLGLKRNTRRRIRSRKESDESDEDYDVGADEEFDEYCSFDGDESEESFSEFEDDEELKVKKIGGSKSQKSFPIKKANGTKSTRKKKRVLHKQQDDDDEVYYDDDDDDDDDDDEVYDDEDDEEFTLDKIDYGDDEDEMAVMKKTKKASRPQLRGKCVAKEPKRKRKRKRKRNSKVLKKPMRNKSRKRRSLVRKTSNDGEFTGKNLVVEEKNKKLSGRGRWRRFMSCSDSDFVSSGSSDYEYTISEEEREQVREANKFCTSLTTSLRSSSSSKRLQEEEEKEEEALDQQRKCLRRKGKEKVEGLKNEIGKQVCGICLSEEGKKIVRGTLNCCSHYFCFACIMEWSKVESRCPLCKQRFMTISKPARSNTGFDLRTVTIQVPERDQVYQPSEEELMGYIDPYENVICTECLQGGDDALILLCDICDSSAHTYCVGLGREVPEGNWYCEGCRPTAFGSSAPQASHQITSDNLFGLSSPAHNGGALIDLNSTYVPDTPLTQETSGIFSLGHSNGDFHPASPAPSGSVAYTVSERRRIQRRVRFLFSNRSSLSGGGLNGVSDTTMSEVVSLGVSQLDPGREIECQHGIMPERFISGYTLAEERLQDDSMSLVHNMAFNSRLAQAQPHPCSGRSSVGYDASTSHACREESCLSVEKRQVQQIVKSHLDTLSRDIELGYSTFKEVARSSTHTILAACGLEHRESEVYPVQPHSTCHHVESRSCMRMSLMRGHCPSCFDLFIKDVVRKIMDTRIIK